MSTYLPPELEALQPSNIGVGDDTLTRGGSSYIEVTEMDAVAVEVDPKKAESVASDKDLRVPILGRIA